jgi:prepilin-type N-terminal cleavage/methylation domain-containing protein/prepilin-type processing-associated H-X9-DG protein
LTFTRSERAFTLTELLIVLAVLAVIATMVVPTIERMAAIGRQTVCKSNLNQLGKGYLTYQANNRMMVSNYRGALSSTWTGVLIPFLGNDGRVLICPESPVKHHPSKPRFGQSAWHDMTWDFFNFPPVWENTDFQTLYEGGSMPSMWKLNDEDYDTWRDNAKVGWGTMGDGIDDEGNVIPGNEAYLPQYTPGKDPNSYWIVLEDSPAEWTSPNAGGVDYVDLDIHVIEKGPGIYEFTFYDFGNSVARHWVIDADDEWHEIPPECESGFGPFNWADAPTNYGMTRHQDPKFDMAERKTSLQTIPGTNKVLMLDYDELKCELGPPMPAPAEENSYENNVGARHLGRCNFLFADGSVSDFFPDEMSPRDPDNYRTFWHPTERELPE